MRSTHDSRLRIRARGLFVVASVLAIVVAGCWIKGSDGYMVWFSDSSGRQHVIAFEGYSSTDDPDGTTINELRYRLEPGATNTAGPFVDVDGGREGAVVVLDASCSVIQRFPVSHGDYKVEIDADGTVDLTEYGFGRRPSDYPFMAQTTDCASVRD